MIQRDDVHSVEEMKEFRYRYICMKQIVVRCNVKKDQNDIFCRGIKRNNLIEELSGILIFLTSLILFLWYEF